MLVICHYGEIALKGGNRKFFEEKLVENIKKSLKANGIVFNYVRRISGRILVGIQKGDKQKVKNSLEKVFGITYFVFTQQSNQDIESIKNKAIEILKSENFNSFKVQTKRGNKSFTLTSQQVSEQVGEAVLGESGVRNQELGIKNQELGIRVDLHNPDVILYIEITEKFAFLYVKKFAGPGGLPLGVSSRAISLISGGIDSPVASYLMMK